MKDTIPTASTLLFEKATVMGFHPKWVVKNGTFIMSTPQGERYVSSSRHPQNATLNVSMAINKYTARMLLEMHGYPNIPFCRPKDQQEAQQFLANHGKVIAKPIKGAASKGVVIVTDPAQLTDLDVHQMIFEKYICGKEMRYVVLDGEILAVHRSDYGVSVAADRELKRISYPESEWDQQLVAMSKGIVKTFGLHFAAVDYLIDDEDVARVLEINTAPGFKWLHAPTSGVPVDAAGKFLQSLLASPL